MSKNTLNNKLFLKRWFSLVLFLDKAKIAGLFPHNPCLFQKDSLIHGSRDVLLKIASLILSGIGDIIRFLKFYGYILNYEDSYIDKVIIYLFSIQICIPFLINISFFNMKI